MLLEASGVASGESWADEGQRMARSSSTNMAGIEAVAVSTYTTCSWGLSRQTRLGPSFDVMLMLIATNCLMADISTSLTLKQAFPGSWSEAPPSWKCHSVWH